MARLALYPGTFDPPTNGHLDVLRRALRLFDRVEVTVAVNAAKRTLFTDDERVALWQACVAPWPEAERVDVVAFEGLLVDHARARGAAALVRGIRQVSDFDYEFRMALANRRLHPRLETVFLTPSEEHAFTAGSLVREIYRWGGDISSFVPAPVLERLQARHSEAAG
ncbi:MAG: pantetheine-phosphate adenylyltransferase [Rhodothermales bacterium]|nr:pantetheine-phosphate adenylyltransferase [Rhodothermales bacterium]